MDRLKQIDWRRTGLIALVVTCVAYAPIAITALWPYASPGAPALGPSLIAHLVSPRYAAEAVASRMGPYRHSLAAMVVHSVLGGLLMLLGPVQLLSAVRRRTRLHRAFGVVFAATVYVSMAGAAIYLVRTAPKDAYSGPMFWIALGTILVGTVMSVSFGILSAVGKQPDLHQRWMLLCYGYLMTAPLLRLEWGALPLLFPGLSMSDINRIATMHLGSLVVLGALVASRALDRRKRIAGLSGSWAPTPVLLPAQLAGAAAVAWICVQYAGWGAQAHRMLGAYLLPLLATWALMQFCQHRAGRDGRSWAREEWRLHLLGLSLAPVFSLVVVLPFERAFSLDRETALSAAVAIGCGMLAFWMTAVVSVRVLVARETVRLAATSGPSSVGPSSVGPSSVDPTQDQSSGASAEVAESSSGA